MKFDPAAACRYFSAEDACRLALQAYYAAAAAIDPPPGEPWELEGCPYATPTDFLDAYICELHARLGLLGLDRLGTFTASNSAGEADFIRIACRIAPEKTAALISMLETDNAEDGEAFSGDQLHDLPPVENALHNANSSGSERHG